MSAKARSEALRKILAQNIEQSAATPAPLTVTGAGTIPTVPEDLKRVKPLEVMTPESGVPLEKDRAEPTSINQLEPGDVQESDVFPYIVPGLTPLANALKAMAPVLPREEPAASIPRPEKLSVLLGASELAILERFHEDARGAGIKMRKGGNPSLFVRAALRLLDQVGAQNADEWAKIVAGTLHDAR